MDKSVNATLVTSDTLITQGKNLVYGFLMTGTFTVEIYDSDNDASGNRKFLLETDDSSLVASTPVLLPYPVSFERGLYVNFSSGSGYLTVLWKANEPTAEQIITP